MSGEIVKAKDKLITLRDLLEKAKPQIGMALPAHIKPERLIRVVMTSVQTTPQLMECEPRSVLAAAIQSAQLGLEPGVLGHSYLVPFNNNKTGKKEAQFIPGYRGLIDLARRSGSIESIQAHVVREKDFFDFAYGTDQRLNHVPHLDGNAGPVKCAYAVAKLKGGEVAIEVMSREEIEAIRKRSRSGDRGPWSTDWDEMARKTVVRRLCKYLPMSIELMKAAALDEQAMTDRAQEFDPEIVEAVASIDPEELPKDKLDVLADAVEADNA